MTSSISRFSARVRLMFTGLIWLSLCLTGLPAADSATDTPKKEAKKDKWDVANPPGCENVKSASIDVTEGTWLNVDVSPDGTTLVFDVLGDLYSLPISGGEAKPITSGLPWDMQP